jgi:hypothetical protein
MKPIMIRTGTVLTDYSFFDPFLLEIGYAG